ncbi:MAG: PAAR-like domain-containing protein [Myxococcota bacterium]|nr:PAAR-like domain-containing protein [Myxococcota bacterium]
MFPASTKGGGQAFAFPDVCKVPAPPAPPIPVPFPNIAMLTQANGGTCSKKVKILNQPVVTKATEIPRTMGDEAGTLKGVSSGTNMDKATFKVGVSKVKVEGNDIVNMLKTTAHNGASANAPAGNVIAPSQTKVIVNG